MCIKFSELSRIISHALRHEPWLYELELDDKGWVPVEMLLASIRNLDEQWDNLQESDLAQMITSSAKVRHELRDGKIKALYGHSIPGKLLKTIQMPPEILYHGTSLNALLAIRDMGLLPMGRQYVHLSTTLDMAKQVSLRKNNHPILLTIGAEKAAKNGVVFYKGNNWVWLADQVPPEYIEILARRN